MFDVVDMPWDWPVEVNYHEAKAFCTWKGPEYRLPAEAEHHVMRGPQVRISWTQRICLKFTKRLNARKCFLGLCDIVPVLFFFLLEHFLIKCEHLEWSSDRSSLNNLFVDWSSDDIKIDFIAFWIAHFWYNVNAKHTYLHSQAPPTDGTSCDIIFRDDTSANNNLTYGSSTVSLWRKCVNMFLHAWKCENVLNFWWHITNFIAISVNRSD